MLKASETIFVYVNTHIINIIHRSMYIEQDKIVWGTKLHYEGKGRAKSLGKGIS